MPDYVRVRDESTGHEFTIPRGRLTDGLKVIDKPAMTPSGRRRDVTYRLPLGTPRPGSKQERRRSTKKTSEAASLGKDAGQTSATPEQEN